jgi:hypothetical protein
VEVVVLALALVVDKAVQVGVLVDTYQQLLI